MKMATLFLLLEKVTDVTSRNNIEEERKRLCDIFDNIHIGLHVLYLEKADDKEGRTLRIINTNKAAEDISGIPNNVMLGHTIDEAFPSVRTTLDVESGKCLPEVYANIAITNKTININNVHYEDERIAPNYYEVKAFPLPDRCVGVSFTNITEQIESVEALTDSQNMLDTILQNMPGGLTIISEDYKIIQVNNRTCEITGYTEDELVGQYCDIICPKGSASKECPIWALGNDTFSGMDTTIKCKDGQKNPILKNARKVTIEGKQYILENFQDISKVKEAEEKLQLYKLANDHSVDAVFWIDASARFVYVNEAASRLLEYSQDELLTMTVYDIDPALQEHEWAHYWDILKHKKSFVNESKHRKKSGVLFPVELTSNYILYSGKEFNCSYARDITERKRSEQILRESEERIRTIYENSPILIYMLDENKQCILWNKQCNQILGWTIEEINTYTNILSHLFLYPEAFELAMQEFIVNPSGQFMEWDTKTKNQEIRNIMWAAFNVPDGTVIGLGYDITDAKKHEKEKARLEEQYRQAQKVESIGRLAGGVAHDLNNLLTPILGYTEILLHKSDFDEDNADSLKEIMHAGVRARDLVKQLLAFSRKQLLEYKPLHMNTTIRKFEKLLRRTIRENIEIEIKLSDDIRTIMADVGQIEQVIMNLAINAQDAMPEGGKLTIETGMVDVDHNFMAKCPDTEPGHYVKMAVSDTGCGMSEEVRSHIFEPFFSTKGEMGNGLGLATVYGIVKQHAGNIFVFSKAGMGTTFEVFLPISEDESTGSDCTEKNDKDHKGSETILLVEDNAQIRRLGRSILELKGYNVLVAENGDEAQKMLKEHNSSVHLLLTDVIMPGMNGKMLYEKTLKIHPELKVVYMSGYTDDVIASHGIKESGMYFLDKPFTIETMSSIVREALDSYSDS